jgi:hypothetical protein
MYKRFYIESSREVIGNDNYIEDIKFGRFSCAIRRYGNTKEVCASCKERPRSDDGNAGEIVEAIKFLRTLKIQESEQDSKNKCRESSPESGTCRAVLAERHEGERVFVGHGGSTAGVWVKLARNRLITYMTDLLWIYLERIGTKNTDTNFKFVIRGAFNMSPLSPRHCRHDWLKL